MTKIELMAPARTADIGMAAINCGADAVYIGAERFGAREDAGNSVKDIARLTAHAHQYYARVYATLNTILHNEELPAARSLILQLYEVGIDGLIIQDTGLLELDLPPVPLVASTQMHNHTPEKVLFLEKTGFTRAILARELTIEQIRHIRRRTTLELECFIHGALCVGYSGQCYLSYAIGGRSSNRGACAQPCRRQYSLVDTQGKTVMANRHLLSLKDMDRSLYLTQLMDAGVTSFKIEGRLKDISYVKNIVGFYRKELDQLLDGRQYIKSSSGTATIKFTPDPLKTFNRGYTDYGLTGPLTRAAAMLTPKSMGEPLGKVTGIGREFFTIAAQQALHPGDGLCFFDAAQCLQGTVINKVDGHKIFPDKMLHLAKDMVIYRNHDHAFFKQLGQFPCQRSISVRLALQEDAAGYILHADDEDGNQASFSLAAEKQPADKKELAQETILKQLLKLGNTIFRCIGITNGLKTPYFIPVRILNQMRRGVIDELLRVRAQNRPAWRRSLVKNDVPYPETSLTFYGNVLNDKAKAFYERHGVTSIEPAAESGLDMQGRAVMTTRYCIRQELGLCEHSLTEIGYTKPLYLVDDNGCRFKLEFDCQRCGMKIYSNKNKIT